MNGILKHRNAYDSSYAAYYTPWVQIGAGDQTLYLPPSGHVIGIYARTDNDRGVWKAPANEVVRGITGMQAYITTGEQDILNPRGVNAIRRFEGRGIRVWGARTLSSDPEFRYINVRRFLIFMEASLDRGTQWVVFEPNAPDTWSRVVDSVSAFLHTQWRVGRALRQEAGRRVLRPLRRNHDDGRRRPERPPHLRHRRGHRAAGRVRDLPHRANHRVWHEVVSRGNGGR